MSETMHKQVDVSQVLDYVNGMLASPVTGKEAEAMRQGAIGVLEFVLNKSGNYNGFRYLRQIDLGEGIKPGIRGDGQDVTINGHFDRFRDTDDTRRFYFDSPALNRWRKS